jgi:hypothetical protein
MTSAGRKLPSIATIAHHLVELPASGGFVREVVSRRVRG